MQTRRHVICLAESILQYAFAIGNDGVVYWTVGEPAGWVDLANGRDWRRLGGYFPSGHRLAGIFGTIRRAVGLPIAVELFVTGNDGIVYTSWGDLGATHWSGENDNWRPIGGFFPVGAPLAAVSRSDRNMDIFVVGNDGVVYTSGWTSESDWSGINNNWRPIGGFFPAGAPISVVSRAPNVIDLFVTGNDGVVYTSGWTSNSDRSGLNNNWRPIGGFFPAGTPVEAVTRSANNIDLFVTGYDGVVYTSGWTSNSDWSGSHNNWRPIGGFFPAGALVAAVCRTPNNIDLFIAGNDGVVYTNWWASGSDWSGINNNWQPLGGVFPPGNPVAATSTGLGRMDLLIVGNDGFVYTNFWRSDKGWSVIDNNWRRLALA